MLNVWIDELTPCLRDNETGDFVQTEVVRIRRKSFLAKFNKKNGWYTDWENLLQGHEIYALVVKGTVDIQGMVALSRNDDYQAVYVAWTCAAPLNNKMVCDSPKYSGVGGHLFAIAADSFFIRFIFLSNSPNMDMMELLLEMRLTGSWSIIIAGCLRQSI